MTEQRQRGVSQTGRGPGSRSVLRAEYTRGLLAGRHWNPTRAGGWGRKDRRTFDGLVQTAQGTAHLPLNFASDPMSPMNEAAAKAGFLRGAGERHSTPPA